VSEQTVEINVLYKQHLYYLKIIFKRVFLPLQLPKVLLLLITLFPYLRVNSRFTFSKQFSSHGRERRKTRYVS